MKKNQENISYADTCDDGFAPPKRHPFIEWVRRLLGMEDFETLAKRYSESMRVLGEKYREELERMRPPRIETTRVEEAVMRREYDRFYVELNEFVDGPLAKFLYRRSSNRAFALTVGEGYLGPVHAGNDAGHAAKRAILQVMTGYDPNDYGKAIRLEDSPLHLYILEMLRRGELDRLYEEK